jgi:ribonuclease P protein component
MPRDARAEGFSRRYRFTLQGSFGAVLQNSRKFRSPHAVLHVSTGSSGSSRLGVAIARRVVRSAVERNRMKRAAREAFRRHPVKGSGLDLVLLFRSACGTEKTALIMDEVRGLFDLAWEARG